MTSSLIHLILGAGFFFQNQSLLDIVGTQLSGTGDKRSHVILAKSFFHILTNLIPIIPENLD